MATQYRVYVNDGAGGAVDTTTPLTTTALLTYTTAALTAPGDYTFLVRTYDSTNGWEETNNDARVRLILDAGGNDITNRPASPTDLSAIPIVAGGVRIEWADLLVPGAVAATGFKVWVTTTPPIDYTDPVAATMDAETGRSAYTVEIAGLTDAVTYTVGVRATNATGDDANENTVTVIPDATGPLPVDALTAEPTF